MPFYQVMIEGSGLRIESSDGTPEIAGFFATRVVWAKTRQSAERAVIDGLKAEWSVEPYVSQPGAESLSMVVSDCQPLAFIRGLVKRPAGFTFFSQES